MRSGNGKLLTLLAEDFPDLLGPFGGEPADLADGHAETIGKGVSHVGYLVSFREVLLSVRRSVLLEVIFRVDI